jgi:nucleoside-diphosphate-sugar epimerase
MSAVKFTLGTGTALAAEQGRSFKVNQIDSTTDCSEAVVGHQCVIHTATCAHIMSDKISDQLVKYCRVNMEGKLNLVRQAAEAGVRRFIFISSITANGKQTFLGKPLTLTSS